MSRRRPLAAGLLLGALAGAGAGAAGASDQPALTVQLNGPLGAPFAGYFVADYQGFYDEAEVAVTLVPGGPGVEPAQAVADGSANLAIERMPAALAARERGVASLVNIGQFFARPAMEVVCAAGSGVGAPADLRGKRLGVWSEGGDRQAMLAWLAGQGLAPGDVTLVDQAPHDPAPLRDGRADCISAMTYDERARLVDNGVDPAGLVVLPLADYAPAALEEGVWVPEAMLGEPHTVWALASFLYASRRGWEWALANPVEAVRIVQEYDTEKTLEEKPEVRRMREVARLVEGSSGKLDPAAFERTVALLLAAPPGPDRAITRPPGAGAWSHKPADEAGLDEE